MMPTKNQPGKVQSLPNTPTVETILTEFDSLVNDWPGYGRMKVGIVGLFRMIAYMAFHDYAIESEELHAWEEMVEKELDAIHSQLQAVCTRLRDVVDESPRKVVNLSS